MGLGALYLSTKGPYRDAQGEVVGLLGVARDITEQKRAEDEVRQSQQKLRIHFEHTPLAVVEWDLDFRVAAWNPSGRTYFRILAAGSPGPAREVHCAHTILGGT